MDIEKLERTIKKYFENVSIECESNFSGEGNSRHLQTISTVTIAALHDEEVQIRTLAYENNGCSQVTFNLGAARMNMDLVALFDEFNLNNFGFKAVYEYDEIRFYNQAFFKNGDDFMYNLDMVIAMFLNDDILKLVEPMLEYIKR